MLPTDHSDWPHDLASLVNVSYSPDDRFGDSGSGTAAERRQYHHCGAVAQPFPDVTMCLSTIWLLSRCGSAASVNTLAGGVEGQRVDERGAVLVLDRAV